MHFKKDAIQKVCNFSRIEVAINCKQLENIQFQKDAFQKVCNLSRTEIAINCKQLEHMHFQKDTFFKNMQFKNCAT